MLTVMLTDRGPDWWSCSRFPLLVKPGLSKSEYGYICIICLLPAMDSAFVGEFLLLNVRGGEKAY